MPDIKSLNDFYDPTKTGLAAMQVLQGQQHLALQAQQVQQQQANQEIDNLKQAAQLAITENPSQAAPVYNALMRRINGPEVTDANAFSANPQPFFDQLRYAPGTKEFENASATINSMGVTTRKRSESEANRQGMLRGAAEAITKAGGTATPDLTSYVAQSERTQTEIAQATYDPHKQAEAAAMKTTMAEHAGINAELLPTLDMSVEARRGVKELAKITPKIAAAQAKYEKDLGSNKGITYAAGARREALAGDPDVAKYMANATASVPKIEEALAQTKQQIDEATKEAHHLFAGTKPGTTEDSLHTTVGGMKALEAKAEYLEASLALAKDPMNPAKHAAVNQIVQKMDARAGELYQAKTALSVRQDALQAAAHENELKRQLMAGGNVGQRRYAALPANQQTPQSAARIAEDLKREMNIDVGTEEIMKGAKLPNQPGVSVNLVQEKQEAKTVGAGFGEQYLESQKAGRAALLKESKLNRMESLLSGMDTGKITPAMTEIAALGQAFGIEVDPKLGAKQALIALSNEIALDFRNPAGGAGMPGNLSNYDLQFLRSMPPDLAKTPAGNRLIIETARQIAKRDQHTAKMARTYRKEHGQIDEGFYDEMTDYAEAHPLFKNAAPGQATPGTANSANPQLAPFDDPEWEKKYQEQFKPKFKGEHK